LAAAPLSSCVFPPVLRRPLRAAAGGVSPRPKRLRICDPFPIPPNPRRPFFPFSRTFRRNALETRRKNFGEKRPRGQNRAPAPPQGGPGRPGGRPKWARRARKKFRMREGWAGLLVENGPDGPLDRLLGCRGWASPRNSPYIRIKFIH